MTLSYEGFGVVHIYRESPHPANVMLLVSGSGGWTGQVVEMAKGLASLDSLVIGTDLPVITEVEKLKGKKIICVYGLEEGDDICRALPAGLVQPVPMKGDHHFGGDYKFIADLILTEARQSSVLEK